MSTYDPEEKPFFRILPEETDEGKTYTKVAYIGETDCIISFGGKNIEFRGVPRLIMRTGSSKFGEQLIMECYIKSLPKINSKNTKHDTVEIYLPLKEGMQMLKQAIRAFEMKLYGTLL